MALKSLSSGCVKVRLDGEITNFLSVSLSNPHDSVNNPRPTLRIKLTLMSGEVIEDDGTRIKVLIDSQAMRPIRGK